MREAGHNPSRRALLALAGAQPVLLAAGTARADAARTRASPAIVKRIAFGSCADQRKEQPVWDAINEAKPDLFVFLGDNVYIDSTNPHAMRQAYQRLAAKPGFKRLRETTPIIAVWDDHDFGANDAGEEFPAREASRAIFCDFWGEAPDSPRRSGAGIHIAETFGPIGQSVQIILPDLRMRRARLRKRHPVMHAASLLHVATARSDREVAGPYKPSTDPRASMLDSSQWQWLEDCLRAPATLRILASSLQVVADFTGWEAWANYPGDRARLLDAIRRTGAAGLICVSGDTHYGEVSCLPEGAPYPLWDFTSSGLTEVWRAGIPNRWRRGDVVRARNFGLIDIDWTSSPEPLLTCSICDERGVAVLSTQIDAATLKPPAPSG